MWQDIASETLLVDPDRVRAIRVALENRAIDLHTHVREVEQMDPFYTLRNLIPARMSDDAATQRLRSWLSRVTSMPAEEFLVTLACYPDPSVAGLLRLRGLPATVYRLLAVYPSLEIVGSVAQASSCPDDVLDFLARHHSPDIRAGVAGTDARLPHPLQMLLAGDQGAFVRMCLVRRNDINADLLATIVRHESDAGVLLNAVRNPSLPVSAAKELMVRAVETNCDDPWFHDLLRIGLRYGDEELTDQIIGFAEAGSPGGWNSILSSPNTPVAVLVKAGLRRSRLNVEDANALAANPSTPAETLDRLVRDRRVTVVRTVAMHPNTTPETLAALRTHQDASILEFAFKNPNMPVEHLHAGLTGPKRTAACANPSTPPGVLHEFLRWVLANRNARGINMFSDTQRIFHALIQNPALPVEAWEELIRGDGGTGRSFKANALQSELCPPHLLMEACMSQEASLRRSASSNKNCPEEGKIAAALFGAA